MNWRRKQSYWQYLSLLSPTEQHNHQQHVFTARAARDRHALHPLHPLDCAAFWRKTGAYHLARATLAGYLTHPLRFLPLP